MSLTAGLLNLVLGIVYTSYGIMTVVDMKRGWKTSGFSHFGLAWILMAFTCGPHHLEHGMHILFEGRTGGSLDVLAVGIGFPAGVTWFLLRVEAMSGGRGDRTIKGTPLWVEGLPAISAMYVAGGAALAFQIGRRYENMVGIVTPNLFLVVLYCLIGAVLLRTQLDNHRATGDWSLSGVSLTIVFPTCALMHAVYALYATTGQYVADWHVFAIDIVGVPAAAYFLWVVWSLWRGSIADWNSGAVDSTRLPLPEIETPLEVPVG